MRRAALLFTGLGLMFAGALAQAILKKAPHWVLAGGWEDPAREPLANAPGWVFLLGLLIVGVRAGLVWGETRAAGRQETAARSSEERT